MIMPRARRLENDGVHQKLGEVFTVLIQSVYEVNIRIDEARKIRVLTFEAKQPVYLFLSRGVSTMGPACLSLFTLKLANHCYYWLFAIINHMRLHTESIN